MFEKELVCAPCRHAKMVASSHSPLTDVMIERPCKLLHMDLVVPTHVRSEGGKWYILVVVLKASKPLIRVLVINDNHYGLTFLFEL
jgi:hypothetical protein